MFIDMHSHILPGIDDGSKDFEMTKNMLHQAREEGISEIIATPHYIPGFNKYTMSDLLRVYNEVNNFIDENKMGIKLHLGNELFFDIDALDSLRSGDCFTLANSDYVLIEFSSRWNKDVIDNVLYNIQLAGYKLILAHVERYDIFHNPEILAEYISKGCLVQVNASSLLDRSRSTIKYLYNLIDNNYVHFISSDCHSDGRRGPKLKKAYEKTKKAVGLKANDLFYNNAKKIIEGKNITVTEPSLLRKTRWWGGISRWINKK